MSKILSIQKQNDSIYSSLVSRNIDFERTIIDQNLSEEEILILLNEENNRLKEIVKLNKPPEKPKEEKKKVEQSLPKKQDKLKEEDEEDNYEEPIKKFDTITNMEDLKRGFFNGEYDIFEKDLKLYPFRLYRASYKYNSDKDGVPDFSAKNLLKGFVRNFDDYRKYFMICFRCWKFDNKDIVKYKYDSLWIVNTLEPISNVIGSVSEDFEFEECNDLEQFIFDIKKISNIDDTNCIGESYVH